MVDAASASASGFMFVTAGAFARVMARRNLVTSTANSTPAIEVAATVGANGGVTVTFASGATERFDLVVGADGRAWLLLRMGEADASRMIVSGIKLMT